MVAMFGASALYHRGKWSIPTAKKLLQLDHTAIFLLIAGTYTPIALLAMDGPEQVITLSAVWLVAAAGIVFEWMPIPAPRGYVTSVYMFLGWIGAFAFVPLYETTGWLGIGLVAGGGLAYTIGAIVHAARRPDPWPETFGYHEIFHVFVILAALLHYFAIAFLVLPLD
jgi:hemolysin III